MEGKILEQFKKQEFKVGDQISNNDTNLWGDTKFTIKKITGNLIKCLDDSSFPGFHWFDKKDCSPLKLID